MRLEYLHKMKKSQSVVLVLVGTALGCGAASTIPMTWAAAAPGEWSCHDVSQFPDPAASGASAAKHAEGMNNVAAIAPAGTIVSLPMAHSAGVVCVKH
jgi:hypothetical protein